MLKLWVPIDLGTVASTACSAFAIATPMRVRDLLSLGVAQVLGRHAPTDRCERGLATTLAGLRSGHFVVDIDGRTFSDPDSVVVCGTVTTLRFFAQPSQSPQRREPGASR